VTSSIFAQDMGRDTTRSHRTVMAARRSIQKKPPAMAKMTDMATKKVTARRRLHDSTPASSADMPQHTHTRHANFAAKWWHEAQTQVP
jgi:hypothetical protein